MYRAGVLSGRVCKTRSQSAMIASAHEARASLEPCWSSRLCSSMWLRTKPLSCARSMNKRGSSRPIPNAHSTTWSISLTLGNMMPHKATTDSMSSCVFCGGSTAESRPALLSSGGLAIRSLAHLSRRMKTAQRSSSMPFSLRLKRATFSHTSLPSSPSCWALAANTVGVSKATRLTSTQLRTIRSGSPVGQVVTSSPSVEAKASASSDVTLLRFGDGDCASSQASSKTLRATSSSLAVAEVAACASSRSRVIICEAERTSGLIPCSECRSLKCKDPTSWLFSCWRRAAITSLALASALDGCDVGSLAIDSPGRLSDRLPPRPEVPPAVGQTCPPASCLLRWKTCTLAPPEGKVSSMYDRHAGGKIYG
mmetsp:Transcript_20218/g.56078  ORF Transcript_20218/g.56078 Transcript_20218/m.56078 type:complete len:367 (+) Transcript_20218:144-1244(+)